MSDISSKSAQRSAFSVRDICYSGLFAAVIAIMAQVRIWFTCRRPTST